MKLPVKAAKDGITLYIYAQPSASKSAVCGIHDEMLKIRLAAKAQDGAANQELRRYLSSWLKVPSSRVNIVHGASGRRKVVHIAGEPARLTAMLAAALSSSGDRET